MNKIDCLIQYAMSWLLVPYKWGGDDPIDGIDCSGFVQECLASIGLDPDGDQTAQLLYNHFIDHNQGCNHEKGAIAFYGSSKNKITHVAIMINDWQIIGANGGGPNVIDLKSAAQSNAFVKIRPLIYRKDLFEVLMPIY